MKRIKTLLFGLLLCIALQAQNFGGTWSAKDQQDQKGTSWVFSLMLWSHNNKYAGEYIFTTQYGDRIQTGDVKVLSINGNTAKLRLINTSDYKGGAKNCTIKLLPDGKLVFLCPEAKSDYSLPTNEIMKQTRTEKELIQIKKKWGEIE